jgi:hypothetical protein
MKKLHYFIGQKANPFHLSVGAVVVRGGKICCSKFPQVFNKIDVYTLMRETLKPNDTLEKALKRGLQKEFGIRAKPTKYLGIIVSHFTNWQKAKIEKTTLYFLCKFIKGNEKPRRKVLQDFDGRKNMIEWKSKKFLILRMKKQGRVLKRIDMDESRILERV